MKRTLTLLLTLGLFVLAGGCGSDEDESSGKATPQADGGGQQFEPIRVLFTRQPESLALFVAKEAGIFDDHGLDVTLDEAGPDSQVLPAVIGGSYEVGHTTAAAILLAASQGQDLVFASGQSVNTPDNPRVFLMASKSSGVTDVEGLADKRIAVPGRGGFAELGFAVVLKKHGVDPDSVKWVPMPFPQMNDALTEGVVDAAVTVVPFSSLMTKSGHVKLADGSELGENPSIAVFSARRDWADENADALYEFRAALDDAAKLIAKDPKLAREVEAKYTGLPPDIVAQIPFPNFQSKVTPASVQLWLDILVENGVVDGDLDPASLIVPPPK